MNLSTLAYKFITGEWKIDRQRAKEFAEINERYASARRNRIQLYAGAEPGQNRPTANILSTPEDYRQAYERIILIRAARQMEEDMPFFDGILSDFETYVVGDLLYRAQTGIPEADALINDYLLWEFDQSDYSQRLDLTKIARLSERTYKRDGECGFIFVDTGDSIKISYVSGDRIGNPLIGANIGPNNYNGIIVNELSGAPIAYDIYRRIPKLNAYEFQKRVDANSFMHLYDPFRFEQYHGVSGFKNAIEHAFDMKQIIDFTKLNIKFRSAQLPYVTNEQGKPRGNGYEEQTVTADGTPRPFDVQMGDGVTQSFLKLGEGVMNYPNDFPNQQFASVMDELKRECAVGSKLPLEFCFRSETGGVVQRFYVNKAEQTFNEDKRWMKRTLLNPYKNRSIQKGIDTGRLDLGKFGALETSMERFKGNWQMGRSLSVDYKNEVTADMTQIDAGVMSEEDYTLENGRDLDTIRQQKKNHTLKLFEDAAEIAKRTGQDVAVILPFLVKKFPNPGAGLSAAGESKTEPSPQGG
jgi:capsid protein